MLFIKVIKTLLPSYFTLILDYRQMLCKHKSTINFKNYRILRSFKCILQKGRLKCEVYVNKLKN